MNVIWNLNDFIKLHTDSTPQLQLVLFFGHRHVSIATLTKYFSHYVSIHFRWKFNKIINQFLNGFDPTTTTSRHRSIQQLIRSPKITKRIDAILGNNRLFSFQWRKKLPKKEPTKHFVVLKKAWNELNSVKMQTSCEHTK